MTSSDTLVFSWLTPFMTQMCRMFNTLPEAAREVERVTAWHDVDEAKRLEADYQRRVCHYYRAYRGTVFTHADYPLTND